MTKAVKEQREKQVKKAETNFMGGVSYALNPLETMKMVTASSIFGEPQYYRDGEFAEKGINKDKEFYVDKTFTDYSILSLDKFKGKKTSEVMETVIDESLKYDFEATIKYAVTLRKEFLMRLNPQVIMVRAACLTEERKKFTEKNPGVFNEINMEVMQRADDVISQITYYVFKNKDKSKIPNILKKSWAKKIESLTPYEVYKYKNKGLGLIDSVRICHANNALVDELMRTGTVQISENNKTWETLRASGMSWEQILDTIKIGHMATIRNLRGIFTEIDDMAKVDEILEKTKKGVKGGKQFPFRYLSASNAVKGSKDISTPVKTKVLDGLEDCLDISCENLPKLKGTNVFLSDNSGSAWGACPSEYGSMTVAKIGNLSSVIGAANSDSGIVIKFGDRIKEYGISKRQGLLSQAEEISNSRSSDVGGATECGIWLFFDKAITNKEHYDNIFIYSDMQAGHGGLYGTSSEAKRYMEKGFGVKGRNTYIDVAKLIDTYRREVNPKVNVYSVQTAGYTNVCVPENGYRTNILYGWTGKELVYADAMNKFWDEYDETHAKQNKQ